jgi:hypothetical protein
LRGASDAFTKMVDLAVMCVVVCVLMCKVHVHVHVQGSA